MSQVATVCCSVVNAAEEKLPLAAVANRQSRQMFFMPPPPLFNYYNPYGGQILLPTEQDQIDPGEFSGDSKSDMAVGKIMDTNEVITLSPDNTLCKVSSAFTVGFIPCMKSTIAATGSISITFTAAQVAAVTISPRRARYTKVKITCTDLIDVIVLMKSSTLQAGGLLEATEDKPTLMVATVASGKTSGTLKCKWSSL
ncbi:hypothetical protein DAPPUDRAFT_312692 [Daphnia pulex]|uniref:Uncharacterized protein n=1 Tax=Daphnia pulex TaxID=6669 RepID=E9FZY8_DAPPU|nr:hypothetical protein DAPPUDRAFT_312692 [Daphnia pulex]|eukprot:EFX87129.1 hypothetical protein DAPPUDRAFT_312692 [Daphnia pulex]